MSKMINFNVIMIIIHVFMLNSIKVSAYRFDREKTSSNIRSIIDIQKYSERFKNYNVVLDADILHK